MRRFWSMAIGAAVLAGQACLFAGCAKDDVEEARKKMAAQGNAQTPGQGSQPGGGMAMGGGQPAGGMGGGAPGSQPGALPPGHPPMGGGMGSGMGGMGGSPAMGSTGPTDANPLPLKLTGANSAAELQRDLAKLSDKQQAAHFEQAFRLTFCADATKRNYADAEALLEPLITSNPKFAPAYRTRGYARFNLNPTQPNESIGDYEKAVQIDPKYGEAYYAIAFMCAATGDKEKGFDAYKKAMALGLADERNIGARFYADMMQKK
jgi:tetratricopeptide (TPR) repeat protein